MILEGNLRFHYNNEYFDLIVKTFLKSGVYYFFVSDKEKENALLEGETLQLTYTDTFNHPEHGEESNQKKIPADIISAIELMLLENKQLWIY